MADCVAVAFGGGPANGRHAVMAGGVHCELLLESSVAGESTSGGSGIVVVNVLDDIVDGGAGGGAL